MKYNEYIILLKQINCNIMEIYMNFEVVFEKMLKLLL